MLEAHDKVLQLPYRGAPQTVSVMREAALDSQNQIAVRTLAEEICQQVESKDYASKYLAIYYYMLANTRYMRDPRTVELVKNGHGVMGLGGHFTCLEIAARFFGQHVPLNLVYKQSRNP